MNPLSIHHLYPQGNDVLFEQVSLKKLLDKVPTPFYLYSQNILEEHLKAYKEHFVSSRFDTQIFYASKAFNIKAMLELVNELGLGVDVVSAGELYTALQCGFERKNILLHGNNKSQLELDMALSEGIGVLVADNAQELERLVAACKNNPPKEPVQVLLRINPGIEAHTHHYIVTGHIDSKFGFSMLDEPSILQAIEKIQSCKDLVFAGLHCHIGSQILDLTAFEKEVEKLGDFVRQLQQKDITIDTLDLGGGFAVWYDDETPPAISEVCSRLLSACDQYLSDTCVKNIWIEPGRSVVANAGITLYTIGDTKKTPNKTYYFVDGGMNDNIRPALYEAKYRADILESLDGPKDTEVTVAGKCCESGDILIEKEPLPAAKAGDHLITYSTGAYGYSMASNYNKLPVPGVYFVKDNTLREVVRPQSLQDLIARENERVIDL